MNIGPYAGGQGGQLLYEGKPKGLLDIKASVTAKHLLRYLGNYIEPSVLLFINDIAVIKKW